MLETTTSMPGETTPTEHLLNASRPALLQDQAWRIERAHSAGARLDQVPAHRGMARTARVKVGQLLVLLGVVIILQIYTLALSSVMKSIETLGRDLQAVEEELRHLAAASVRDESAVFKTTYARFGTLQRSHQASQLILVRLAAPWHWIFAPGEEQLAGRAEADPSIKTEIRVRTDDQGAHIMLQALALYLLPLLYGLLGASAFVLRALGQPIGPSGNELEQFRLRLALGALLGATVGLFFSADTPVAGTTLSLVTIAFLAGYSVEFFFGLFDFIIAKVRDSLPSSEAARESSGSGTATAPRSPARATVSPSTAG